MIKIRPAQLKDFKEIAEMYKDLIVVVYKGLILNEDIFFYGAVQAWYQNKKDMVVSYEDTTEKLTGFSLSYIDSFGFMEPYYMGDIIFIKPEFRKGRSAYLLYNNVVEYADGQKLPLIAKAYIGDGNIDQVDKIQSKFGEPIFKEFIRIPDKG